MEVNTTSLLKVFIGAGVAVGLLCATAQGQPDPLISGNNVRPWDPNGAIATTKFPTPGSTVDFIPDGTKIDSNGGHGLLVLGNKVYYTELANIDGPTDKIRTAPFNGGHGGPDNGALTNPRPGCGVKELAYHDGYIYALTGDLCAPLQVFRKALGGTNTAWSGPVTISSPASPNSDGFTILAGAG